MERTILSFFDHTSYTGRKEYIFCINIGNTKEQEEGLACSLPAWYGQLREDSYGI